MPQPPRLILFTRYPTPGAAKTRLIPALCADGAARLHRRLTERTLATMRASGLPIELRVTGAAEAEFRAWIGDDVAIVDQGPGDLGDRLARAAADPPVIFLGADAPHLTADHIRQAVAALEWSPVTIGPAEDGGYYLLGLAGAVPDIFGAMPWGSDAVLAETIRRLETAGIEPALLETLADLDRPEDLARWPELAR